MRLLCAAALTAYAAASIGHAATLTITSGSITIINPNSQWVEGHLHVVGDGFELNRPFLSTTWGLYMALPFPSGFATTGSASGFDLGIGTDDLWGPIDIPADDWSNLRFVGFRVLSSDIVASAPGTYQTNFRFSAQLGQRKTGPGYGRLAIISRDLAGSGIVTVVVGPSPYYPGYGLVQSATYNFIAPDQPVPEPSAWLLSITSLAALLLHQRRRQAG